MPGTIPTHIKTEEFIKLVSKNFEFYCVKSKREHVKMFHGPTHKHISLPHREIENGLLHNLVNQVSEIMNEDRDTIMDKLFG
jgi:hypothetical protein